MRIPLTILFVTFACAAISQHHFKRWNRIDHDSLSFSVEAGQRFVMGTNAVASVKWNRFALNGGVLKKGRIAEEVYGFLVGYKYYFRQNKNLFYFGSDFQRLRFHVATGTDLKFPYKQQIFDDPSLSYYKTEWHFVDFLVGANIKLPSNLYADLAFGPNFGIIDRTYPDDSPIKPGLKESQFIALPEVRVGLRYLLLIRD
ncbi:MAG: hypothetical protein KC456_01260 [Flavobacteriales bacterium]|nr:hypothetical protein [Flavobacteriales bacterium]